MSKRLGLAFALCAASVARADVDLFPKRVLEPPRSETVAVPIDSPWRAVERNVTSSFHPTVAQVTDEAPPQILARQIAHRREPGPSPSARGTDDSRAVSSDPRSTQLLRETEVDAARDAYEEPAQWMTTELEARVDTTGRLLSLRVTLGSGRAALDALAVETLRRAIGGTGGLSRRDARVRLRVESGVRVAMPARAVNDETRPRPKGVIVPLVRGRFGSGQKTETTLPLQAKVRTRVTLLGVESAR